MRITRSILTLTVALATFPAAPAPVPARAGGPGIGRVVELSPPAEVKRAGAAAAESLEKGAALRLGDALRTGAGGRIKMSFDDQSTLILAENSRLDITRHVFDPAANNRVSLFKLYEGKVRAIVGELFGATSEYRIESPTGVAGVKGTDFEEHYAKPCTLVLTHTGAVGARNSDPKVKEKVTVRDDEYTLICEGKAPTRPQQMTDEIKREFVVLRANETIHPPDLTDQIGDQGGPPRDNLPPSYPSDVINQPTDTGGLPPGPIPEPEPPKNP